MSIAEQFESKLEAGQLVAPIPRWRIILKRVLIWTALSLFVVLGVVSAGITAWFLLDPTDLLADTGKYNLFSRFLEGLPLFWAVVSIACALIAVWVFTKSPRGYRFRVMAVALSCLIAFLALGAAMAIGGIADTVESLAADYLPPYRFFSQPMVDRLMKPREGTIIGRADDINTSTIQISDPSGNVWQVMVSQQTKLPGRKIQTGNCLRIVGESATDTQEMQAETIGFCPRGIRLRRPQLPIEIRTQSTRIIH